MKSATTLLLALLLSVSGTLCADTNAEADHSKTPEWAVIKDLMFGDRVINPDDRDHGVLGQWIRQRFGVMRRATEYRSANDSGVWPMSRIPSRYFSW